MFVLGFAVVVSSKSLLVAADIKTKLLQRSGQFRLAVHCSRNVLCMSSGSGKFVLRETSGGATVEFRILLLELINSMLGGFRGGSLESRCVCLGRRHG